MHLFFRTLSLTLSLSLIPAAAVQNNAAAPVAANVTSITTINPVTVIRAGDIIVIQSSDQMRYRTDPITRRLILEGVALAPGAVMPEGLTWTKDGGQIQFTIPDGTTYALSPDGRSLILTPPGRQAVSPIPSDERVPIVYPLSFGDPAAVSTLLQSIYPGTRVVVDTRQRALIVIANPADRNLLLSLIRQLDASRPQIQFEAEIVEVNRDMTDSLGLQYDSLLTLKLTEGEGLSLKKIGTIGRSPLGLTIGLNALQTSGAAKVLARPRITTIDGLEARINSTQTTPVITSTTGGTSVQSITTGITLRMLPRVSPDGTVETNLTITVSVPTGTTSQGVPAFSTREATTTVRVANGEPIAIGGLLEDRTVNGVQKVPVLGNLPVIGKLFTTTRTDVHRSDLIIVVTPRLVLQAGEQMPVAAPTVLPSSVGTGSSASSNASGIGQTLPQQPLPTGPTPNNTPSIPAGSVTSSPPLPGMTPVVIPAPAEPKGSPATPSPVTPPNQP